MKKLRDYVFEAFGSNPQEIITSIKQDYNPQEWKKHRFGLSDERWKRLEGKAVWVTGAGTGYGRSISIALAAAKVDVILSGRRKEKLLETIETMKSYGIESNNCKVVCFDIKDYEGIEEACRKVEELTQNLYGLVNNAALPQGGNCLYPLGQGTHEQWDDLMKTNVTGPWYLTKVIMPHMLRNREVRVVFITSEAGWAVTPGYGMYNVSKAALNSLAGSFAAELIEANTDADIQLNALIPGEARTEMNRGSSDSPFTVIPMLFSLLSHPSGGPNGRFFHRDGRHFPFAYVSPYNKSLYSI